MDNNSNNTINSCLMLAIGFYTPVDLAAIFDSADLRDTGLELDSHLTLLYAQGKIIPRASMLSDIDTILGPDEYDDFLESIKTTNHVPVLDMFELGNFKNDSDYIVLKLRKDNPLYTKLALINKGLRRKYNVQSDFSDYTPHMTLAELAPGSSEKYMLSKKLELLLKDSVVDLEDIMISYGTANDVVDRKQYFLTQYKNIDRYFRLKHLREMNSSID